MAGMVCDGLGPNMTVGQGPGDRNTLGSSHQGQPLSEGAILKWYNVLCSVSVCVETDRAADTPDRGAF